MKSFQKGYLCEIHSWENDADFRSTKEITLQDLQSVKELKEVLCFFVSNQPLPNGAGKSFGNGRNEDYELLAKLVTETITTDELKELVGNSADSVCDFFSDLIGFCGEGIDGFRVFDYMLVYYVPEDVSFPSVVV